MPATINIDDELLKAARELTGLNEKTALIRAALQALVERESALSACHSYTASTATL